MSQHDYNIANDDAADVRTDLNNVFSAIATMNSGDSAPSTTFANMLWYKTDTNILYMRNEANTGWIELARLDQTNNRWSPTVHAIRYASASEFQLLDSSGNKIIGIGQTGAVSQGTGKAFWATKATAVAGTAETGVMNEKRCKEAIDAQIVMPKILYNTTLDLSNSWVTLSLESGWRTTYTHLEILTMDNNLDRMPTVTLINSQISTTERRAELAFIYNDTGYLNYKLNSSGNLQVKSVDNQIQILQIIGHKYDT